MNAKLVSHLINKEFVFMSIYILSISTRKWCLWICGIVLFIKRSIWQNFRFWFSYLIVNIGYNVSSRWVVFILWSLVIHLVGIIAKQIYETKIQNLTCYWLAPSREYLLSKGTNLKISIYSCCLLQLKVGYLSIYLVWNYDLCNEVALYALSLRYNIR